MEWSGPWILCPLLRPKSLTPALAWPPACWVNSLMRGVGSGYRSWRCLLAPDPALPLPWTLPTVLVPGRGLAAVLRTLPMFHDEDHAWALGLPEDTLVLP